jgi:hypothetical protein
VTQQFERGQNRTAARGGAQNEKLCQNAVLLAQGERRTVQFRAWGAIDSIRMSSGVGRRGIGIRAPDGEMRNNEAVTTPDLAPRRTFGGVIAVWIVAALIGIGIGLFVPEEWRAAWLTVGLGGCLVLSFAIQLWFGRSQGFTERVAAGVLGALLVMGLISLGFGLSSIVPA